MSKSLQILSNTLPALGSIEAYMQAVNRFPLLTADEELELANRLHKEGDLMAAQQLILSHLRYVVRIAKGYLGYGLALADLVQEGTIGLMKAVKRFRPDMGARLVTFAVHWIKSEIHDFVIKNWRLVKVATTKAQRKLFFNLRRNKKHLGVFTLEEAESVAKDLNVTVKEVLEMEKRLLSHDITLERNDTEEENENFVAPIHYLEAPEADPYLEISAKDFSQDLEAKLHHALENLDVRSRDIVKKRWLEPKKATLKTLAQDYNISMERIRQIEQAALVQLRAACSES